MGIRETNNRGMEDKVNEFMCLSVNSEFFAFFEHSSFKQNLGFVYVVFIRDHDYGTDKIRKNIF